MTKPNTTLIAVVLDRSGSMSVCREDTIGGFNTFLKEQKAQPSEGLITLTQFDHEYDVVYNKIPLKTAPELTANTYVPRGNTALLDAIGRTINDVGSQLAVLPENQRPSKVIFVIITDGQENASREYTRQRVFDMITHQRDKYDWEFVYLGANQDAIGEATSYGILSTNAVGYTSTGKGTRSAFKAASASLSSYRGGTVAKVNNFFGQGKMQIDEDEEDKIDAAKDSDPLKVTSSTETTKTP